MRVIFTAESATQLHHVRFTFLVSKPDSESADQRWPCGHFTWKILFQCELLKWAYQAASIVWEEETLSTALFQLNVKQKHNNDLLPYVKCSVHSTPSQKLVALSLQCLNMRWEGNQTPFWLSMVLFRPKNPPNKTYTYTMNQFER